MFHSYFELAVDPFGLDVNDCFLLINASDLECFVGEVNGPRLDISKGCQAFGGERQYFVIGLIHLHFDVFHSVIVPTLAIPVGHLFVVILVDVHVGRQTIAHFHFY